MAAANIAYTMKPVRYDPVYCLENPSRLGEDRSTERANLPDHAALQRI
jgi:hypothetical protein